MIYDFNLNSIKENTPYWFVCKNITKNQRVLDVGCATGYLGQHLKEKFDVDIVGIDNEDYHLEKARERKVYSDLIKLDMNFMDKELERYDSYFDRIVICDVLEHLNNPIDVLKKLSKLLKNNGKFLIDIPNIAHGSIKYKILSNDFNYTPMGILDETHYRFFTLKSIIEELSKNKYLIENVEFIFSDSGSTDQEVDYLQYPQEIIDFIENDPESSIFQIFLIFSKSNMDLEDIIQNNNAFKELDKELNSKKEHIISKNHNPLKSLEQLIQENKNTILEIERENNSLNKIISEKNNVITRLNDDISENKIEIAKRDKSLEIMKNSRSWKLTKPIRFLTTIFRKFKTQNKPKNRKRSNKSKKLSFAGHGQLIKNIYLENPNSQSKDYVKRSNRFFQRENSDIKLISFYLPQFHTIKENDMWWGKGFTEWVNVTRAVPQIEGQYQPHLPDELGFYDLSNNDVFYKQVEMAKQYGLYGFCFHYYWFSGKMLLEKPIFNYLNDKNLDFPFMLCWANEPWTRAWDGSERDVLMAQPFEEKDYIKFIEDIMPFFKDDRYIKIDNCPVLIVYRPQYFSNEVMSDAIEVWRNYAKDNGFDDIYLINAESHDFDSDNKYENFDASVQFFSYKMSKNWRKDENAIILNPEFRGRVFDYESFVREKTYLKDFDYTLYRTVLPSWDNTARTMSNSIIFNNSSPKLYKKWLNNVIKYTKENHSSNNQFVFLHSWNEWAEGAHLEPDRKYGFAYLEATLDCLETQKKPKS